MAISVGLIAKQQITARINAATMRPPLGLTQREGSDY